MADVVESMLAALMVPMVMEALPPPLMLPLPVTDMPVVVRLPLALSAPGTVKAPVELIVNVGALIIPTLIVLEAEPAPPVLLNAITAMLLVVN
jgi:hypothetical protein